MITAALGDPDSAQGRITRISDSLIGTAVAAYAYSGGSKRLKTFLGGELDSMGASKLVAAAPGGAGGVGSLSHDAHGRVTDLHYQAFGGTTQHRYRLGYDASDNLRHARTDQDSTQNQRSWLYGYDGLQRLFTAGMGQLVAGDAGFESGTSPRETTWNLDLIGNWAGDPAQEVVRGTTGAEANIERAELLIAQFLLFMTASSVLRRGGVPA